MTVANGVRHSHPPCRHSIFTTVHSDGRQASAGVSQGPRHTIVVPRYVLYAHEHQMLDSGLDYRLEWHGLESSIDVVHMNRRYVDTTQRNEQ